MAAKAENNLQVVVLAAGKGVRMRSALPKVLHRLCGWSLLERALRAAADLAPKRIIAVIGFGEEFVRKELETIKAKGFLKNTELEIVVQAQQNGTGHAVQLAAEKFIADAAVVVMPGDCPLIEGTQLKALLAEFDSKAVSLSLLTCDVDDPSGFGRVIRAKDGSVQGIVEHKDCTPEQLKIREINSSIYVFEQKFLNAGLKSLRNDNAQGEYYLTDVVKLGAEQGAKTSAVKLGDPQALLGANSRAELSALEALRRKAINRALMDSGVTLEDPSSTYVDEGIEAGADSFIGAGTRLFGKTKIGQSVTIEGNSLIKDSEVGAQSRIRLSCYLDGARIATSCEIGPFAHLRPGSVLHDKVKIGNFVETKKAELHKGTKANHLSYIGDATVGEEVNVGAGTIFCNYDGVNKHHTEVESGVFIGSNSCLVAPIKIGAGAYIGAGSTINKDVPPGALGIGRERQQNLEGWSKRIQGTNKKEK